MSEEKTVSTRKKSVLWNFFTNVDQCTATCAICRHRLSFKSTTNNLRKHIQRKHPSIQLEVTDSPTNAGKRLRLVKDVSSFLEEFNAESNELICGSKGINDTVPSFASPVTPGPEQHAIPASPATPITQIETPNVKRPSIKIERSQPIHRLNTGKFNTKLLHLFIKDFQPYRILEDVGFRSLVTSLSPSYNLLSKTFVSKVAIPELYKTCVSKTKESIKSGNIFCITLEMWTSANSDSFLSITAHFVNEQFQLVSLVLDCSTITFARNSDNFAFEIKRIVTDWGIEEKIQFAVSENDHDIQNAITDILGYEHFSCFADTMSTIVREAIGSHEIFKIIEKVSALVSFFKRNTQLYEKLITCQKETGEVNVGLKQVSDMRCFRSIYFMLDKFVRLESIIKDLLEVVDDDIEVLTDDEWKVASQLCNVLKPFESVIMTISKEKYCSASMVIPVVNGLYSVCDNLLKKLFSEMIIKAISDVKEAITSHLSNIETSATLSVCTFLDPRFKDLAFSNRQAANHAKEVVISALTSTSEEKTSILDNSKTEEIVEEELTVWHVFDQAVAENRTKTENPLSNDSPDDELSVWSTFDHTVAISKPKMTASTMALEEVRRYLDAEILPRQEDPLNWWKENKQLYPQLSALARSQLCAVSMSVPCDRVFTKSGMYVTERRNRLSERNTKMLVFLNANL